MSQPHEGKILIVDDSPRDIEKLYALLKDRYQVIFAQNATKALNLAKNERPDLILSDIMMPDISGLEFCAQLKSQEITRHIPLIFLTGKSQIDDMVQGFEVGAADYITKPVNATELILRVGTHLTLRKTSHQLSEAKRKEVVYSRQLEKALLVGNRHDKEAVNKKPRILIIDDSIANIQNLNEILKDDYEILFATSGEDGIQKALTDRIDLILLDIQMPGMNGYEVCRELKSIDETHDIPVIFVTAMDEVKDEAEGLDAGAIDYIVKPYSHRIVEARVRNHMELIRHRDLLRDLSLTDGLTGLPNRRQFDQILVREWRRGERQATPLSLMVIDLDNFKLYNDHFGHQEGDNCLRKVAATLNATRSRLTDFVGRYGGEEFVAILPDTLHQGAIKMAGRILQAIRESKIPHPYNDGKEFVTVSIGLYSAVPSEQASAENIVREADRALYMAKEAGRNQVVALQESAS